MPKQRVQPECKYRHGPMRPVGAPGALATDQIPAVFSANAVQNKRVILGSGYMFHIWECPTCTYLEFHDYEP